MIINGDKLAGTPAFKLSRLPNRTPIDNLSVYRVEVKDPPPTFNKGDGYDSGRNLLGALLIGPSWRVVGWVIGERGEWRAYRTHVNGGHFAAPWQGPTVRKLARVRGSERATVALAGRALVAHVVSGNEALA